MSFSEYFSRQAAKPSGWFGRWVMSLVFDKGNAELNRMMKGCLRVQAADRILEIGCGTGKVIHEMAPAIDGGCIEGVEISETMASIARKRNKTAIDSGRVIIHLGDFNMMSFNENTYDTVCTCNTIYFWSDPLFTLKKVHSLLKSTGKLIIAFEDKPRMEKKGISTDIFHFYSQKEIREILKESGFNDRIDIKEKSGRSSGLCCAVAIK